MNEPFVKKDSFNSYVTLNKETFKYLIDRLKQIGLYNIQTKTPKIVIDTSEDKQNSKVNIESKNIYKENEFLALERDFKGVLLSARNSNKEEIKILFANQSTSTLVFDDDIFALIKKDQSPKLYVSTNGPVTTYAYAAFIKDFMEEHSQGRYLTYFLLFLVITLVIGIFSLLRIMGSSYKLLYAGGIASLLIPIIFFLPQTGLHLVDRKRNLPSAVMELKKSWIVILFTILGTELVSYLVGLLTRH